MVYNIGRPLKGFFIWKKRSGYMRTKVILVCEECLGRNYTTSKNPQKNTERIELKKYCKTCNKYTIHKETK